MSKLEIGIRKNVENGQVQYWLVINAKSIEQIIERINIKERLPPRRKINFSTKFIGSITWSIFLIVTVIINTLIVINYFLKELTDWYIVFVALAYLTDLVYWIDFATAVTQKIIDEKKVVGTKSRHITYLVIDGISLLPLSIIYLLIEDNIYTITHWALRMVTVLRFYRIPIFLSQITTAGRNYWIIFITGYIIYLILSMDIFSNIYYVYYDSEVDIYDWNESVLKRFFIFVYYSVIAFLNVGLGDISIDKYWERVTSAAAIFIGNIIVCGVITGTLAIALTTKHKRREIFRQEYKGIKVNLKRMNIDKKVLEKISENILLTWKQKTGHIGIPLIQLLPLGLQKDAAFDINYNLINRSLIFSKQPRAFLRSVLLQMQNLSYLPGDIVVESSGMAEGMICVASGVIEILSEDNDESALLSFTNGTILSEAALFISLPNRCVIRAATYVELQVLMKVNFARVALRYPEIYRSMQEQIFNRLNVREEPETVVKTLEPDFYELSRRKVTKRLIQELKRQRKEETKMDSSADPVSPITKLYVWSENIPRMKILPINLVQGKPWILRPNSFFLTLWEAFILVVINLVACLYPYLVAFDRKISSLTYLCLAFTNVFYVCDLIVQCLTAVERKDNFTYIISRPRRLTRNGTLKHVGNDLKMLSLRVQKKHRCVCVEMPPKVNSAIRRIKQSHELGTIGFYLDVLSTYNFNIYAESIWPENYDYTYLLLSLNRLLKCWRMAKFFRKQENNLNQNLLLIITVKYIYWGLISAWWISAILYLEACPNERCLEERWFAKLESEEAKSGNPNPITNWPALVSMYWTVIILYGVGYGEISPKSTADCVVTILAAVTGACLLCLTMAHASSTFRHLARTRTVYQEEIIAVERFMEEHDLPKVFKLKVKNYFRLQWNYDQGFILKHANVVEGLVGHQKNVILNQLIKKFLAVPIFQDVGDDFLRILAKTSRMCVLPPNEMITEAGSFVREMYILESGYCEVYTDPLGEVRIIGPVNSFGFIEMLLGTPMEINVRTITHARIIFVDHYTYLRATTKFPAVKKHIDELLKSNYGHPTRTKWETVGFEPLTENTLTKKLLKQHNKILSSKILNAYKYHKTQGLDYWKPFQDWGKFRIFQFCFLPFVILPCSSFIKIWMVLRLINAFMIGITAPIHYSFPRGTAVLNIPMTVMVALTYVDMYMMFHVGYYDERGLLICHPAKTAVSYLKGNFALDLITAFPFQFILTPATMDSRFYFYNALKLIIVLQFYKIWQACYYLESDIMRKTDYIKILKFVPLTFVVTNLITGLLIIVECSNNSERSLSNKTADNLHDQLVQGLLLYCPQSSNDVYPPQGDLSAFKLYIIVYYWVTYTMTQTGFGDVTDHHYRTLIFVIIITVVGIFLYGYMFASLTSVKLSTYNVITNHRKMILEMINFMKLHHVNELKQKQMSLHYEYSWLRKQGATPQTMFAYVPTTLRENILAKMYEATIRQVPAFAEIDMQLIKFIGRHLKEIYFLRGETIVDYHDKQEYIYLIYRGKVEVTSNTGKFVTSLESGGLFGNISNKPFCLSSVVVTAVRNADILRLDSLIFFKALQVFPEAKSLLDYLVSQNNDFIEPLSKAENAYDDSEKRSLFDTIPFEITSLRRIRPDMKSSSTDLTKSNEYFHFYNAIYKDPKKPFVNYVILHTSALYKLIDIFTLFSAYVCFVVILYIFAFQDFSVLLLVVSYLLDLYFYVRFALEFNFSFFNKHGDVVVNTKWIRRRYLQSKVEFSLGVISNLPLEVFAFAARKSWILPVLSFLRLNRLLRLHYILGFYRSKFNDLMVNKVYLHLSYIIIIVSLMVHALSCLWYFTSCPFGFVRPKSWISIMGQQNAEKWKSYIVASYYICTLFTTTGFGDIRIFLIQEIIVSITIMILTRFALAWITSSMASIAAANGMSLFNYHEKITDLKSNFMRQNLSKYQLSRLWHYVSYLWVNNAGRMIPEFITTAPYAMKCEIMNEIFGRHLSQAYPFSQMEEAFLRQLAIYLQRNVYFPGNYILQQGDTDRTMYFIHKGQVLVLTIGPDMIETIHFKLQENDHFGMSQGLIMGKPHAFSYRAKTEVEILSLNLNEWDHLFRYFPDVKDKIYKRINNLPSQAFSSIVNI